MDFTNFDPAPIWLTLKLASVTVLLLLIAGTPIAWWLAHTRSRLRVFVEAVVALPLVLPPTVLGFYLLIALGPNGWLGGPAQAMTGSALSFTFTGLVIASTLYSLPFVVQPLHSTFEAVGKTPLETAWVFTGLPLGRVCDRRLPAGSQGIHHRGCFRFRPHTG